MKQKQTDGWVTAKPNGAGGKGAHILLNNSGEVVGGMGGKFNGKHISEVEGEGEGEGKRGRPKTATEGPEESNRKKSVYIKKHKQGEDNELMRLVAKLIKAIKAL